MMTLTDFLTRWLRARERIVDRHRNMSWRRKRGGKNKGVKTQEIRMAYQHVATHNLVPVRELAPKTNEGDVLRSLRDLDGSWIELSDDLTQAKPDIDPIVLGKMIAGKITPAEAAKKVRV